LKSPEFIHEFPIVIEGNVSPLKGKLKIIPVLDGRIIMAHSILDQGGPPIHGLPLKAQGNQRHLPFFTDLVRSK